MAALQSDQLLTTDFQKGLTSEEAVLRLEKYGPNILPEKPPPGDLVIFLSQLKNPLVYLLLIAGLVTLILGNFGDTVIIFLAVFVNTVLGFFQERKADRALYALKKLIYPEAKVIRNRNPIRIKATEIVPGDICLVSQGDKIPADGKVLQASKFFVSEAVLTGESLPVEKKAYSSKTANYVKKDKKKGSEKLAKSSVFMGTIVTSGHAKILVERTGHRTMIGRLALSVQEPSEDTPLKRQMKRFSKQLAFLVLILNVFVFLVGALTGKSAAEMFTVSVALAVSAVPEGLLVGLTVVLAIGMQRILKRKGLVRRMVSAETLGGVTTICIDKTGTLTLGKMQVTDVVGKKKDLAYQVFLANDLDDPVVIAAYEWGKEELQKEKLRIEELGVKNKRLDSLPFSPKERFFASLNRWNEKENMLFVNGAPELLLNWVDLDREAKERVRQEIEELTSRGKRVIGFARKKVPLSKKNLSSEDVRKGLEWVGMLGFSDPVRVGVKAALEETKKAGIKLLVITGDYPNTAIYVMRQLGIDVDKRTTVTGDELKKMSSSELAERLSGESSLKLFARTTPAQKLKIVKALKKKGEIVAMMGDGVNDAPALKHADIGIVVGDASDVAKEMADLVLLDSNFATIAAAIEEGRGIFDNVRKIILYLISDAFCEILAVVGTIILGLPLPVTAAQVLWINLVSDGFPHLALTVDPKERNIMYRSPRPPWEPIVNRWMKMLIAIVSFTSGLIALTLFIFYYRTTGDEVLARSITFLVLGVNSLIYVFSIRTLTSPFWKVNPLENKWLNLAVFAGLVLQFFPFAAPVLRGFFGVKFPGLVPLVIILATGGFVFIIIEALKAFVRRNLIWFQH